MMMLRFTNELKELGVVAVDHLAIEAVYGIPGCSPSARALPPRTVIRCKNDYTVVVVESVADVLAAIDAAEKGGAPCNTEM